MRYIEILEIKVVTIPPPTGIPHNALGEDSPLLVDQIEQQKRARIGFRGEKILPFGDQRGEKRPFDPGTVVRRWLFKSIM